MECIPVHKGETTIQESVLSSFCWKKKVGDKDFSGSFEGQSSKDI